MKTTYSTKEASEITGASRQIIRTYTGTYARKFSTEGAPEQAGQPRSFTRDDLRLIRFIYVMTKERGQNHNQVMERIERGELDEFDWEPPDDVEGPQGTHADPGTVMVPMAQLQAARLLLEDAQRREQELQQRVDQRDQRLEELRQALGRAEGELAAYKAMQQAPPPERPKSWWARLWGG
jgi:DNA-binding transcriptional MerR regulator